MVLTRAVLLGSLVAAAAEELEQLSMLQTRKATTRQQEEGCAGVHLATKRCEGFFLFARNECPSGSRALLSAQECEIASSMLSSDHSKLSFQEELSTNRPTGCYTRLLQEGGHKETFWNSKSEADDTNFAESICYGFEPDDEPLEELPGANCEFRVVKQRPAQLATVQQVLGKFCADGHCDDDRIVSELNIGMWHVVGLLNGQIDGKGHWNDNQAHPDAHTDAVEEQHQAGYGDFLEAICGGGEPVEVAPPPAWSVACPSTGATVGQKCFFVHEIQQSLNYAAAKQYCTGKGAQIAAINTKAENNAVLQLLAGRNAYIGADRSGALGPKGVWRWEDGSAWKHPDQLDIPNDDLDSNGGTWHGGVEDKIAIWTDKRWHDWAQGGSLHDVVCQLKSSR
jgi:hypothetical protein